MDIKLVSSKHSRTLIITFLVLLFGLFSVTQVCGATLRLTPNTSESGIVLRVDVDKVEKLAGMKLMFEYSEQFLKLNNVQKAQTLNSFMQVVNDKTPGRTIVVMASASGVSGENFKLLDINFSKILQDENVTATVAPKECQMMSETLQDIPCTFAPISFPLDK